VAIKQDGSGEKLRDIVVAEVMRQLAPLEAKVDRTHYAVERLFNTNGGPEGYLQGARREDNARFEEIFAILNELTKDMGAVKEFVRDHEKNDATIAADVAAKVKRGEWRSNRNLALATIIIAAFSLLKGCGGPVKALLLDPSPGHSQNQLPQTSTIPVNP